MTQKVETSGAWGMRLEMEMEAEKCQKMANSKKTIIPLGDWPTVQCHHQLSSNSRGVSAPFLVVSGHLQNLVVVAQIKLPLDIFRTLAY